MESEAKMEVGVNVFFAISCGIVAVVIWGAVFHLVLSELFEVGWGFYLGGTMVLVVNALHFAFGCFHIDDDMSDLGSHNPFLTRNYHYADLVRIRAVAIITIGLSRYLNAAIQSYRRARVMEDESG